MIARDKSLSMHEVQRKILHLIDQGEQLDHMSLREIGSKVGVNHPQKISHHLLQLQKRGFIDSARKNMQPGSQKRGSTTVSIPIIGMADCGPATMVADENTVGYLRISKKLLGSRSKHSLFAVQATGRSMNKANIDGKSIEDGDYVIVDADDKDIKDGTYILSVIDDVANIKKIQWDKGEDQIVLLSESTSNFNPIYIHPDDKYIVAGKVVKVIKRL